MAYATPMDEAIARLRRIETRVTVFMEAQGVASQTQRPEMCADGTIKVPTHNTSIQDILAMLESGETTTVHCNGIDICRIAKKF